MELNEKQYDGEISGLREQIENMEEENKRIRMESQKHAQLNKQLQQENQSLQNKTSMTQMEFKRYKEQATQQIDQLMKLKGMK